MRAVTGVMVLLGCFAFGCDDDSGPKGNQDLSMTLHADMTVVAETCGGILGCAAGCADVKSCLDACSAKGSTQAQTKYLALEECAIAGCVPADLGGTAPCTNPPAPTPAPACVSCISNVAQTACSTELSTCLGDK